MKNDNLLLKIHSAHGHAIQGYVIHVNIVKHFVIDHNYQTSNHHAIQGYVINVNIVLHFVIDYNYQIITLFVGM